MVADKFQWVFSESLLNACGTDAKFCRRMRTITPFRLGLALTATCASQRVETLADFHRGFNAVFDTTITYKAFYNQLAKARFATFMGTMASRLIGDMTLSARVRKGTGLCRISPYRHSGWQLLCYPRRLARGVSRTLQSGQTRRRRTPYHHGLAV
jgi:hypothetical protein